MNSIAPEPRPLRLLKDEAPNMPAAPALVETANSVSFYGVCIEKGTGGPQVPRRARFEKNVLTEFDLRLMQKIALGLELNQAILIESGSGLGKTETVERMCSMLNREMYYANCHDFETDILIGAKTVREDTKSGFGWRDGIVVQAIRSGGVLFLDEYNFMKGDTRGRLHEVLDAILRGKDEIILVENDGERVKVHPNFRLIAAQNAPGGDYADREVLDPAQLTRFVYIKEPNEMPKELKEARLLGSLEHLENSALREDKNLHSAMRQFQKFEETLIGLVEVGKLGSEQPQRVYFAFQRDLNRLLAYLEKFYDGDVFNTLQQALRYYYKNRFESSADREQVEELILLLGENNPDTSDRVQLKLVQ